MLNLAIVIGQLNKPVQVRALPGGLTATSFDLRVGGEGQSDSVPVVWFDEGDEAAGWPTGEHFLAVGQVRRRFFHAGGTTQSRVEVVAQRVVALSQTGDARSVLAEAARELASLADDVQAQSAAVGLTPASGPLPGVPPRRATRAAPEGHRR